MIQENYQIINARLKAAKINSRFSSVIAGCSRGMVRQYLAGFSRMSPETEKRLIRFLDAREKKILPKSREGNNGNE